MPSRIRCMWIVQPMDWQPDRRNRYSPVTELPLQSLRTCQQVFSAALIALVESTEQDEGLKNALCTPVPHPDTHLDYLRTLQADILNGARWSEDASLQAWLKASRLDGFSSVASSPEQDAAFTNELLSLGPSAVMKLQDFLSGAE